jgi:hypothetical protein
MIDSAIEANQAIRQFSLSELNAMLKETTEIVDKIKSGEITRVFSEQEY